MDFDPDQHYYCIDVVETRRPSDPDNDDRQREGVVESIRADSHMEVAIKMAALAMEDRFDREHHAEVRRMQRLDAPLTDEEQQDLEEWIQGMA